MKTPRSLRLSLALGGLCASVLGGALAACNSGSTFPDTSGSGSSSGVGGAPGDSSGIGGWNPGSPTTSGDTGVGGDMTWSNFPWTAEDCSTAAQFVYLVATDRVLWRFWPPTLELTKVGYLRCDNDTLEGPFSMAIDRHGTAWVLYYSGHVYKLDLASGGCVDSGYVPVQFPGKFSVFGMAFTADTSSPEKETLFVRDGVWYGQGNEPAARILGRFDVKSKTITPVADNPGGSADLSGTGDGRLWAFRKQPDSSANLAEINPMTGANLSVTSLGDLTIWNAWAVAAWGGDVWMFTDEENASSKIIRYQPATGQFDVVKTDIGPRIIGAGVSSCAPFVPPK